MRAIRNSLSWLLALFLIAVFLHWTVHPWPEPVVGQVIFYDLPGESIVFSSLAEGTGIALFEPTGRVIMGVLELLAAFLLFIPPFRKTGARFASLLFLVLAGIHLSPWVGMDLNIPATGESDAGAAFYLTVAALTASLLLLYIHPEKR
ncbi:hypothetical protein [Ponticaulis koreensis]|uniref:hypothetical protein n=1 Tax=Ponticaulis koreensis TaxID=1123045 RepID=UPI0003B6779D|nr:hypothetical protein [Ponticaulis koreensis]